MISATAEDYLKELYTQQELVAAAYVHTNAIAEALGVTAGTATVMMQGLAKDGYVDYRRRVGIRLTSMGEREALRVVRRHRLVESFLVKILDLDWSEVHEEAQVLEHAVSDKVVERMEAVLGFPGWDPHGDPIPTAEGGIDRTRYQDLVTAPRSRPLTVVRILDQEPGFLRFLSSRGLEPGRVVVIEKEGEAYGAITVHSTGNVKAVLSEIAARNILVEPTDSPELNRQ